MPNTISALDLVDTVYLMSILADQPRSIDWYIDYFGGAGDLTEAERDEFVTLFGVGGRHSA